jgi:hypothetical protein
MTLTDEQKKLAAAEGWGLFNVIENGSNVVSLRILADGKLKHAPAAEALVLAQAKKNSRLHIDVLKAVMLDRAAAGMKGKRR